MNLSVSVSICANQSATTVSAIEVSRREAFTGREGLQILDHMAGLRYRWSRPANRICFMNWLAVIRRSGIVRQKMKSVYNPMPCLIRTTTSGLHQVASKRKHQHMVFAAYLESFSEYPILQQRVLFVLEQLPSEVQRDFLEDPRFGVTIDNYEPGTGWSFLMPVPGPPGNGSRCVILRPKLATASADFAMYVIAHEFAHAFLRNGGWGEITDIEDAADAMAASWGFHRPHRHSWPDPNRAPRTSESGH